jgi:ABC-2 type transport system permease protein
MRAFELFFWPLVQLLVWGFVTMYLQKAGGGDGFPEFITFLIGGIILWDALFRAQQGVSISFLEDVWTRNLLNIFAYFGWPSPPPCWPWSRPPRIPSICFNSNGG